jgi:hypothetical protein
MKMAAQVKENFQDKPEAIDARKMEQRISQALDKALATDEEYQKVIEEHDRHISHWECHYWGSARVYALVGHGLAQAMKEILEKK